MVSRLDVGLEPVQLQPAESVIEHKAHPLAHQPFPDMRQKTVVPEKCALEGTMDQVVHIDDANQLPSATAEDKKTPMRVR